PVRSAFLGAVIGVLGVAAVLVFASSVDHLAATPRLYGWTWNFAAPDDSINPTLCNGSDYGLSHVAGVGDVAALCYQQVMVDGRPVTMWGFADVRGTIDPEIAKGRAPVGANEIALGAVTLHALHKNIGDAVSVKGGPTKPAFYRIVGQSVLP